MRLQKAARLQMLDSTTEFDALAKAIRIGQLAAVSAAMMLASFILFMGINDVYVAALNGLKLG